MFHQNLIDKHICLLNLGELPRACNNHRAGVKGADGNLFTLTQGGPVAVSYTQSVAARTNPLYRIRRRCLVIEILCITPLINGGFKAAEQVILTHENLMQFLAIDIAVDLIVAVNQLDAVAMRLGLSLQNRLGEAGQLLCKPGQSFLGECVRGNAGHLNTAVLEQLDIHFLIHGKAGWSCLILAANNKGGLIEEDVL